VRACVSGKNQNELDLQRQYLFFLSFWTLVAQCHDGSHVVRTLMSGMTGVGSIRVIQARAVVAEVLVMAQRSERATASRQQVTTIDGRPRLDVVRHLLAFVQVERLVVLVIRRVSAPGILQPHPAERVK